MNATISPVFKKFFATFFIVGVCIFSINVHTAKADIWTGTDWANLVQNTAGAVSGGSTAISTTGEFAWSAVGKNLLDAAAYAAAQNLLDQLTKNTIAWIRGGFHGSPSFAVDTNAIVNQITDNIAGGMIASLKNIAVCDFTATYKDDLINSIDLSAQAQPYSYAQKAKCPFKQDYVFKASDFYSDFKKGGWTLMGASLEDGGNPYGLQMITAQEQAAREGKALAASNQKLSWSNGFKDVIDITSCEYPPELYYHAGDPNPVNPDMVLTEEEAKMMTDASFADPAVAAALQDQYCTTATPGKVVGDQLTQTLGVDMDRIGFSDNMNKIISAFLDTATQEAVRSIFGKGDKTVGGKTRTSNVAPVSHSITISVKPVTNITSSSATLNGSITYSGAEAQVRVWFIIRQANQDINAALLVPAIIETMATPQDFSTVVAELKPDTVYFVKTAVTKGGVQFIPPRTTTTMVNGQPVTTTIPSNGAYSSEVSFRTQP